MFYKVGFFLLLGVAVFFASTQAPKFFPPASPPPSPTEALLPTVTPSDDTEDIRSAMAEKHGKAPADVHLTISKKTSLHVWGSVKFTGEIAGGWFLAYKKPTGWIIVDDGNGTISCETIAPYDFPTSMVPECVNANGKLIIR